MLEADFLEMMTDTVTINVFSTVSAFGTASYSTSASTYAAYVQWGEHKVIGSEGQEATANLTVFIAGTSSGGAPPQLSVKDRIALSANWDSIQPRILSVERFADDSSSRYATVAHCAPGGNFL